MPVHGFLSCVISHEKLEESQMRYWKEAAHWSRSQILGRETGEKKGTERGWGEQGEKTRERRKDVKVNNLKGLMDDLTGNVK